MIVPKFRANNTDVFSNAFYLNLSKVFFSLNLSRISLLNYRPGACLPTQWIHNEKSMRPHLYRLHHHRCCFFLPLRNFFFFLLFFFSSPLIQQPSCLDDTHTETNTLLKPRPANDNCRNVRLSGGTCTRRGRWNGNVAYTVFFFSSQTDKTSHNIMKLTHRPRPLPSAASQE